MSKTKITKKMAIDDKSQNSQPTGDKMDKKIKWTKKMEPDKFPECKVLPYCYKCHLQVDISKIYVTVYPEGEELIYHIKCFHKDYTADDLREFAA